jgi:hypothetical protein
MPEVGIRFLIEAVLGGTPAIRTDPARVGHRVLLVLAVTRWGVVLAPRSVA